MRKPTEQNTVRVYRNSEEVGFLERSSSGSLFQYNSQFISRPGGIAFRLPYSEKAFETPGVNLHPFFANLLPEGLRLTALIRKVKTSPDDLLSLLIAAGADTVGDVTVGTSAAKHDLDLDDLSTIDFEKLRHEMLQGSLPDEGVSGVQPKISADRVLSAIRGSKKGRSYLLKLADPRAPHMIQNEHACMQLARVCELPTAETQIVQDVHGVAALLVERFDRLPNGKKVHFEDVCQLLNRYPADKYVISVEEAIAAIREATTVVQASCLEFFRLYAFSYVIGNGDMHAKNVGVIGAPDGDLVRLAPGYDLLTTLPYKDLDQKRAMAFEGKRGNLYRRDILRMAELAEVPQKAVEKMLDRLIEKVVWGLDRFDSIGFTASLTGKVRQEVVRRTVRLRNE